MALLGGTGTGLQIPPQTHQGLVAGLGRTWGCQLGVRPVTPFLPWAAAVCLTAPETAAPEQGEHPVFTDGAEALVSPVRDQRPGLVMLSSHSEHPEKGLRPAGLGWRGRGLLHRWFLLQGRSLGAPSGGGRHAVGWREGLAELRAWAGSDRPGPCTGWWSARPPRLPPQPSVSPVLTLELPPRAAKGVTLVGLAGEGRSHLLDTSLVPGCEDAVAGPPGQMGKDWPVGQTHCPQAFA